MSSEQKGAERASFSFYAVEKKIVGIASGGRWFSSGFFAKIANKPYIVTVAHGLDPSGPCEVRTIEGTKIFVPEGQAFLKSEFDIALIPLTENEAQGRDFFNVHRVKPQDYVGRTVRQIGTRQGGGCSVSSGALTFINEHTLEIDTHTEPGQSGSVNVVDELVVLGIHSGSRPLKVAPLPVTETNTSELLGTKIQDASLEQLSLATSARLIHLAKYGGARAETICVNDIISAHEELLAKGYPQQHLVCPSCGVPRTGKKFCSDCGAKF